MDFFFTKIKKTIEACQELSKTPKNMSNGSKLAKKSQIFVREGGGGELLNTVYVLRGQALYLYFKTPTRCRNINDNYNNSE